MKILTCVFIVASALAAQDKTATSPAQTPSAKPAPAKKASTKAPTKTHRVRPVPPPPARTAQKPAENHNPKIPGRVVPTFNKPTSAGVTKPATHAKLAKPAKPAPAATATSIPKDAVETSPGFYKWTDKEGKEWTFRRTPFGVTRYPANSVAPAKETTQEEETTAREDGDSIHFERTTPFGKRAWTRKKSELNENEQMIWASQQKTAANPTAEKE